MNMGGRIKKALRKFLSTRPLLFSSVYRWIPKYKDLVVDRSTDLVIEGFPRSANTYAVAAFMYAQKNKRLKIARHQHSAAQVLYAVAHNIPCIILVRKPEDAIASYMIRDESIIIEEALLQYINFYEPLNNYLDSIVVVKFEDVVKDFNVVINAINKKYACSYSGYINNNSAKKEIIKLIDKLELIDSDKKNIRTTHVAHPCSERDKKNAMNKQDILISKYAPLLTKAQLVYEKSLRMHV